MSDFTYELPFSHKKFVQGIIFELKRSNNHNIANLLKDCSVDIEELGFSHYNGGGRWNAYAVRIKFCVNPANISSLEDCGADEILWEVCEKIIPASVGYDIKGVKFMPDLSKDYELEDDLLLDLEKQTNSISQSIMKELLPDDIMNKGYHMTELYTYLYVVENSLRLFIEKVCKEKYGEAYFSNIVVPQSLQRTIKTRQENSANKKWLSIRGNELFYLDFKDLGNLIDNNWELFKEFFPNRDFILPKLNEMADCRNLIAHNSYIGDVERDLMKTYYNVILKQITSYYDTNG